MKALNKSIAFLMLVAIFTTSCKREELTPIVVLMEKPAEMAVQKVAGNFENGSGESASGKASLYLKDKTYQLVFEELMVNNGPNLHVYLSKEIDPKNFVDLGDLKSVKGNQVYDIPDTVKDPTSYKYALVYCQRYSHLFGYAPLN